MRLAIDASNIREGGGVTHLIEILRAVQPAIHGVTRIYVWGCAKTLARIEDRPWIEKRSSPALEGSLLKRLIWQRRKLGQLIRGDKIDLLWAPGGSLVTDFRPVVTMSRNMLPFEWRELKRFGFSPVLLKLLLLRWNQSRSFRTADATIFLTKYAHDAVVKITGPLKGQTTVIPHGIDGRFLIAPRPQRARGEFTQSDPLKVIYVSTIDAFKHQWNVVGAIARLRDEGLPVRLDLYGSARSSILPRLMRAIERVDRKGEFIHYWGAVDYKKIHACYDAADMFVFASSCENMPNILIESMAAALPIACSNRGPMPEVLGDAGVYFDPEIETTIVDAIRQLANSSELRAEKASSAARRAAEFSWSRCANETFSFLSTIHRSGEPQPE